MRRDIKASVRKKPRLSNRDLLVISVLSGIGGVMSTYIGYLGNLLNRLFGVPFGAGQFVAGLHVFWIILAAGLVRKPGAATAAGLLKGVVELLTGSTHGIVIVLISLVQGLLVDLVLLGLRRHNLVTYGLAGGAAAAANVFVFQILYFSGAPLTYIFFIGGLAFISGILLAGGFGKGVLDIVQEARPVRMESDPQAAAEEIPTQKSKGLHRLSLLATGLLVVLFSGSAIYYFAAIYEVPWTGPQCRVEGKVEQALTFQLSHFAAQETTITAELKGQYKYVPPQDYTGVPVKAILAEVKIQEEADTLKVTASDGYKVDFPLAEVLKDEHMLLIVEDESLRLIAGNYDGGYWVRQVNRLVIE